MIDRHLMHITYNGILISPDPRNKEHMGDDWEISFPQIKLEYFLNGFPKLQ